MSSAPRFRGGVRSRILLLATLPVLVVSTILTWYFIRERQADLTENLEQMGRFAANYLATASELAMYAEDVESLQQIARAGSRLAMVQRVAFYRNDGSVVLAVGARPAGAPSVLQEQNWQDRQYRDVVFWYFSARVELDGEAIADYEEAGESGDQVLGWVVVTLSQEELYGANRRNIVIGLLIFAITTTLASIAALIFGHRIYQPIRDLTTTVEAMDSGDLSVQAELAGEAEIRILARVINRMASNLRETNALLRREVDQATAGLREALERLETRNAELIEVHDELETAMSARDQFLARMSHELRTPLTTIIGFARRLERSSLSGEQAEHLAAIHQASELLLSVINDILDFSRGEHGDLLLESQEFDLTAELENTVSMYGPGAREKSIELAVRIDPDVPARYLGDASRLKQVVNNLLSNAVKFTDAGVIVVQVSRADPRGPSATESPDRAHPEINRVELEFSVRDSGIGIAQSDLETLFVPFVQADNTISRRFGGSGLGLAICQQLIHMMGGEISISSELGRGTDVRFTVQLTSLEESSANSSPGSCDSGPDSCDGRRAVAGEKARLQGLAVLVAEDNYYNQRLLRELLEAEGAGVVVAENGEQSLKLFRESDCELVLMDAHMPGMDGIEATRELSSLAQRSGREVAVIGLTADTLEPERQRFLEAGAREVLYKPIDEEVLVQTLCRHAGRVYRDTGSGAIGSTDEMRAALGQEVFRLTARLRRELEAGNREQGRETLHQLMGLSGLHGRRDVQQRVVALRESLDARCPEVPEGKLRALEALVSGVKD